MGKIYEGCETETLYMELDFHQEHRYSEQILIAYNRGDENTEPYLSIVLYGMNKEKGGPMWAQVFPNMDEVDIIIKALQEAKQKATEVDGHE